MKKLILALALVLSSLALQACDPYCIGNYNDGKNICPVPGSMVP